MITTARTHLSLFTTEDTQDALDMFLEPDAFKYIKPMLNATVEQHLSFLQKKLEEIRTKKGYYWVVRLKDSNEFIGAINLTPIPTEPEKIQIGWLLKNAHHRKGFATECAEAVMDHAINTLKLTEIYGVYEPENIASEKLFHKLKFDFVETKTPPNDNQLNIYRYTV
ncbi:GNAT family N-acetyltransferase [Aquimarina rhabdastrellae]